MTVLESPFSKGENKRRKAHIDTTAREDLIKSALNHAYHPWRVGLEKFVAAIPSSWQMLARIQSASKPMARAHTLHAKTKGAPPGASSTRGTLDSFSDEYEFKRFVPGMCIQPNGLVHM